MNLCHQHLVVVWRVFQQQRRHELSPEEAAARGRGGASPRIAPSMQSHLLALGGEASRRGIRIDHGSIHRVALYSCHRGGPWSLTQKASNINLGLRRWRVGVRWRRVADYRSVAGGRGPAGPAIEIQCSIRPIRRFLTPPAQITA